ncbi:hypothetical protein Adt_26483 [Abeliophyllum distichum]|uniref:Uncharacterized protein n=1 Tax=Abeliophyllum distichum TaxID=126358 RepID=A0ABD1RR08_9LAMI
MFMFWIINKQVRHGMLADVVLLFILWFLWNNGNNYKHNGMRANTTRIIKRTHYLAKSLLKTGILLHDGRKRVTYHVSITWMKPNDRLSKLNTDGGLKDCGLALAKMGPARPRHGSVRHEELEHY